MTNTVPEGFSGVINRDQNTLIQIDKVSYIIDLYRTNGYIRSLLDMPSTLVILSRKQNLPYAKTFSKFVEAYEEKCILSLPLLDALNEATKLDNAELLKKIIGACKICESLKYFLDIILESADECIRLKAYNCLKCTGYYIEEIILTSKNTRGHFDHTDDLSNLSENLANLLKRAIVNDDTKAIDTILSFGHISIDLIIDEALVQTVIDNNIMMYDYLIKKKPYHQHNNVNLIKEALNLDNKEMVIKTIQSYENISSLTNADIYQI
jgi:hypothetical protein